MNEEIFMKASGLPVFVRRRDRIQRQATVEHLHSILSLRSRPDAYQWRSRTGLVPSPTTGTILVAETVEEFGLSG